MSTSLSSVIFCCDHNAVRSPMAEGIMKKYYGHSIYVQSAGVKSDLEIDGFSIAVCEEIDVELCRHQSRTFAEISAKGDDLSTFDLIVALTPASLHRAQELTHIYALSLEYWPILDPTGIGQTRDEKLQAYRQSRDQISHHIRERFGTPLT